MDFPGVQLFELGVDILKYLFGRLLYLNTTAWSYSLFKLGKFAGSIPPVQRNLCWETSKNCFQPSVWGFGVFANQICLVKLENDCNFESRRINPQCAKIPVGDQILPLMLLKHCKHDENANMARGSSPIHREPPLRTTETNISAHPCGRWIGALPMG